MELCPGSTEIKLRVGLDDGRNVVDDSVIIW